MSDDLCTLVDRCVAGEQAAMLDLVERFRGQIFGLCYRMLGQRQDAEDMTQETFIRVLKNIHRWDQDRPIEPWLLAIAGNRCRTKLASRKRKPPMSPLIEHLPDERPDEQAGANLAEEVNLVLKDLREQYRQAFLLFHEQQLSYIEIGAALDCPVGTAKTWVHRARRELAGKLRDRGIVFRGRATVRPVAKVETT